MSEQFSGILLVDKEKGMTSHDVVAAVRNRFSIKKVGHAGTLDPNATGLLILLLGKATKFSNKFLTEDKEYTALMKLGERTDSADCEGRLISEKEVKVSETDIRDVVNSFIGEIEQVPPMVSAKKINSKRLYKLAREGKTVERQPRKIVVKEIEIMRIDMPFVLFRVLCSKGTYVRQLADDMGEKLSTGAHLTELRRLRSGIFSVQNAIAFSRLLGMKKENLYESIVRI